MQTIDDEVDIELPTLTSSSKEQKQSHTNNDNHIEPIIISINGLQRSTMKIVLYYFFGFISLGVVFLIAHWFPKLGSLLKSRKSHLREAESVLVEVHCFLILVGLVLIFDMRRGEMQLLKNLKCRR